MRRGSGRAAHHGRHRRGNVLTGLVADQGNTAACQHGRGQRSPCGGGQSAMLPAATRAGDEGPFGASAYRDIEPVVPQHPPQLVLKTHSRVTSLHHRPEPPA